MVCPKIPQISYGKFSDKLHNKLTSERIPFDGTIELTMRCNLRCVHCYCVVDKNKKELTANQWKKIIDQMVEAGCLWLLITGGEPLLHLGFLEIYRYAKKKGLLITVFTNGTLLNKDIVNFLTEYPPFSVEISLYGIREKTYEAITQTKSSFNKCMNAIELLLNKNISLKLKTTALTLNYNEITELRDYSAKIGVDFRFDPEITPKINGDKQPVRYRLSETAIVNLDKKDPDRSEVWTNLYDEYFGQILKSDKIFNCYAGKYSFAVGFNGELYPCLSARFENYNLREKSFLYGWRHFIPSIINRKIDSVSSCRKCKLSVICSFCPMWSQWEAGEIGQPIEFLCNLAKLRGQVFNYGEVKKIEESLHKA